MGEDHDPTTLHKYIYGSIDPINLVDPSGNFSIGGVLRTAGVITTLATVGYTSFDVTSLFVQHGSEVSAVDVGGAILLGLIGKKLLGPIAKICQNKKQKNNRCKVAIATVEAEAKMRALVARTPNSRFDAKLSGTFTVRVVSPTIDVKRGRGTAAFNGPVHSVAKSAALKAHAAKFGLKIGDENACGTNNTVGRCAEWRSANNLLKSGSKIKNIRWLAARKVTPGPTLLGLNREES